MSQTSQSSRTVTLVAVVGGNVWVLNAGGTIWGFATNTTGSTLNTTGVVRSAVNNQKLYFADGTHTLYYDPSDNTVHTWVASSGTLPAGSDAGTPRLICTWRGRTVLSGIVKDPQNWFMSAVSDPTNWNYNPFPVVATQAVAGNNSSLGLIGDVITSLVPYSDDLLIFGGDHTIWQCSGDPMAGGQIDNLSSTIGMAWGQPWCRAPDGTLFFLSNKMGLYELMPGQGAPQRISQPVEQLLVNIDSGANSLRLLWDDRQQGFHLFVTPTASASATSHIFWELRTGAWWQDTFANNNHNPLAVCTMDGNLPGDRHNLLGSWDGTVRAVDQAATTDDSTAISSSVVIGPLLTSDWDAVLMRDMQAILGTSSGTVSYAVYTGATAEAALAGSPVVSGTWSSGRSLNTPIRRTAHALWVKLTASSAWAMESIKVRTQTQGKPQARGA